MSTLFVSYRRDDTSGHSGRLYDRLSERFGKERIFRDVDRIRYGDDFIEAIDEAVGACIALIAVIGPAWLTTTDRHGRPRLENPHDFVRIEIESALSRNVPIFPVLVGGAGMPQADDLPESIAGLAHRQALEISETRFDYDVDQLFEALEMRVGLTKVSPVIQGRDPELEEDRRGNNRGYRRFTKGLKNEPFPASVEHKLTTLSESTQLRFLDIYRHRRKSLKIAYLLWMLPAPILGLHNSYLGKARRQLLFWVASGGLVLAFYLSAKNGDGENTMLSLFAMLIWPFIDLFLVPSMVRQKNELIAQEILFGDTVNEIDKSS